jgi:prolyl-tRNA editing enzyme YbaK/EbsC (Cys-tRNA(Pro) deacylase)
MSLESTKEHLKKYNMEDRIMIFETSSATVKEAAEAIHCKEQEIAKTMSFLVEDDPIVIVVAGDVKIDNAKYKQEFHKKAKMVPADSLIDIIGHEMGGVGPWGLKDNVKVYLDESLKRFDTVFPACGSTNSAIELTIEELEKYSNYKEWIDVSDY